MEDEPVDIGFDSGRADLARANRPVSGGERRRLPAWVIALLALGIGWFLGAFFGATSPSEDAVEPAAVPTATSVQSPAVPTPTPPPVAEPMTAPPTAVLVVQAPLRGIAIPAEVRIIEDGIARSLDVPGEVSASNLDGFGYGQRRILSVAGAAVFMASERVMVLPDSLETPVEIAEAIYLLPGSHEDRVWAVTAGTRSVLDIDVPAQRVVAEYDLGPIGAPLGSFAGGLVVTPEDRTLGPIATWNPRRGVEATGLPSDATFIDAGGNTLAIHTADGLAAFDAITGVVTQTERQLSTSDQYRSASSPDGSMLALVERRPIGEFPQVVVLDVRTGAEVDRFETAYEWQMKWINRGDILHLGIDDEEIQVVVRTVDTQASVLVAELAAPNFWVTVLD